MDEEKLRTLRIPLEGLIYLGHPDAFHGFSEDQRASLIRNYSTDVLRELASALDWAAEHPDYQFLERVGPRHLAYDNKAIYRYLMLVRAGLREAMCGMSD